MTATATYVYCLVSAKRRPTLAAGLRGLAGTKAVRLVQIDRHLWLAVADAPLKRYGSEAINARLSDLDWVARAAVEHEGVVEAFLTATAVLPMKLFTLFSTDARAVEHIVRERRRIDVVLERVAHRVEWGVRVVHDRQRATMPGRSGKGASPDRRGSTGAAYLTRKKAQRDAATELASRAQTVVAELYDRLARRAAKARRRPPSELPVQGAPLLLDAAFLVPRTKAAQFRAAAGRDARALARDGYRVSVSGPWPPYSFIEENAP